MGGKIGWIISVLLLVAAVAAVTMVSLRRAEISHATVNTMGAGRLDEIRMDLPLGKLMTVPTGTGAERTYTEAVGAALADGDMFDFLRGAHSADPLHDPRFQAAYAKLLAAGHEGIDPEAELLFVNLPTMRAPVDASTDAFLAALGRLPVFAAIDLDKDHKLDEAVAAAQASLLFGDRLWHHGVYVAYQNAGQSIAGDALFELASLYAERRDDAHLEICRQIDHDRQTAGMALIDKLRICRSLNLMPGDLANLAQHDKSRAWRLQGIMWLGVAQWTTDNNERTAIQTLLNSAALSSDTIMADQAAAALHLTRSDLQDLATPLP